MFTQEQLVSLKGVVVEAVKPMFDGLEKKMDERFDSQEEQIANVSEQITSLDKRMDRMEGTISYVKGDVALLMTRTDEMQRDVKTMNGNILVLQDDMDILKRNKSIWVLGDSGEDSYEPKK